MNVGPINPNIGLHPEPATDVRRNVQNIPAGERGDNPQFVNDVHQFRENTQTSTPPIQQGNSGAARDSQNTSQPDRTAVVKGYRDLPPYAGGGQQVSSPAQTPVGTTPARTGGGAPSTTPASSTDQPQLDVKA